MDLERVFNEAAYPEVTFVRPRAYGEIRSSLKASGKHITVSGASGTGKTTLVRHLFLDLTINEADCLWINGRQYADAHTGMEVLARALNNSEDFEEITALLRLVTFVVLDDFHHLSAEARKDIGARLKLWHEKGVRFIVIGIAASAVELVGQDSELGIRNDPFEMREQDEQFVRSLLKLGEGALNIRFSDRLASEICAASNFVPSVVQVVCKSCCLAAGVHETVKSPQPKELDYALKDLRQSVLRVFNAKYMVKVVGLAQGKRRARAVHNTYFDIVAAIARDGRSEIPTASLYKQIVSTILDKAKRNRKSTSFYNCLANLEGVIREQGLDDTLFYSKSSISIEDPTFRFYLNLVDIDDIKQKITLRDSDFGWDVAVSFAGDIRPKVKEFVDALKERDISVFYDFDQQAMLWGKDLRKLLADVYSDQAQFMVIFLSESYPERDWTEFEVSIGKAAAKKRTNEYLLPIIVDDAKVIGLHDSIGHLDLRMMSVAEAADLLAEKVVAAQNKDSAEELAPEPGRSRVGAGPAEAY